MDKPSPSPTLRAGSPTSPAKRERADGLSASVERHLRDYFAAHERDLPSAGLYSRVLQEIERPLLAMTLDKCRGNQLRAAELLGLNRNTLRKKIRQLGIEADRKKKRVTANDE